MKKKTDINAKIRQEKQGEKMHAQFQRSLTTRVGSIVCLRIDFRDRSQSNPSGVLAVAFDVKKATGGIRVVCEHTQARGNSSQGEEGYF
jgi:hypothetical protein